jgi:hypothetical protein
MVLKLGLGPFSMLKPSRGSLSLLLPPAILVVGAALLICTSDCDPLGLQSFACSRRPLRPHGLELW